MSDLAPLVAAAIRDKVVLDMMEEIAGLCAFLGQIREELRTVAITGHDDDPVVENTDSTYVDFDPQKQQDCPRHVVKASAYGFGLPSISTWPEWISHWNR